jgi:predicted nucleotidyltransferase
VSVVGIVAEYNPLHIGHAYHLYHARKITEAKAIVCVLSSHFTQRGEPSVVNKWARTRMALKSGADLVLELPCAFSSSSAEYFASGAVRILESLNCVDYLCFGSEEGNIQTLERAAELLAYESSEFKAVLKNTLKKGASFAAARQEALESITSCEYNFSSILKNSNNILGIEYIKAIKRGKNKIQPLTIKRTGQDYLDFDTECFPASATAIRRVIKEIFENEPANQMGFDSTRDYTGKLSLQNNTFLKKNLPSSSLDILSQEFEFGRGPVFLENFESILLYLLKSKNAKELSCLPYMEEGLENRFKKAAMKSASLMELIKEVATSRYPVSRIQRVLCALLTDMSQSFLDELKERGYAQYIRILGFNQRGRELLSAIRKNSLLPIITKPADGKKLLNPFAKKLYEYELKCTDVYSIGYNNPRERMSLNDLTSSPVYFRE